MNIPTIAYNLTPHQALTFLNTLIPNSAAHVTDNGFQVGATPFPTIAGFNPVGPQCSDPTETIYAAVADLSGNDGVDRSLAKFIRTVNDLT